MACFGLGSLPRQVVVASDPVQLHQLAADQLGRKRVDLEILERELNYYSGNTAFFESSSNRAKLPDDFLSYLDYSIAAGHDYFKPVPLGLGGISENPFQRSEQQTLIRQFSEKFPFILE